MASVQAWLKTCHASIVFLYESVLSGLTSPYSTLIPKFQTHSGRENTSIYD